MPRILLVEDDRWLAESYAMTLDEHTVDIAASPADAIELLDNAAYDVIVADVMLEYGLVIDLLHELQSHADLSLIPIVLCTNIAAHLDKSDLAAYGVVEVCDKSILTPASLRVTVQRALSGVKR